MNKRKEGYTMYTILSNSGRRVYGIKQYIVETLADIDSIPLLNTVAPGSTVLVVTSKQKYILTRERIWVPIKADNDSDIDEVVYEGGNIEVDPAAEADVSYEGGQLE
jgi:hypothetical protein